MASETNFDQWRRAQARVRDLQHQLLMLDIPYGATQVSRPVEALRAELAEAVENSKQLLGECLGEVRKTRTVYRTVHDAPLSRPSNLDSV